VLLDWLENIATYGIALIHNTPPQEDQLRKVVNRVAYIKRTTYGWETCNIWNLHLMLKENLIPCNRWKLS